MTWNVRGKTRVNYSRATTRRRRCLIPPRISCCISSLELVALVGSGCRLVTKRVALLPDPFEPTLKCLVTPLLSSPQLRSRSPQSHHGHGHGNGAAADHYAAQHNAGQGSRKAEPYFCDRNLVQSLVRDAMVTDELDKNPMHPAKKEAKQQ